MSVIYHRGNDQMMINHCDFQFLVTNGDGKNEQEHNALISRTKEWMKTKMKQACTKKSLHKRIPILTWLPK